MLNNYYLLRRLARAWNEILPGSKVLDAWSHSPGELTVALEQDGAVTAASFLTHAPIIGAFRRTEVGRPRRNVKPLLRLLRGRSIIEIMVSDSDRVLTLKCTGGIQLQAHLYGARANVLLANKKGQVQEAFRKRAPAELPPLCAAPEPTNVVEFAKRWKDARGSAIKAIQRIFVRFNRDQAREVMQVQELKGRSAETLDATLVFEVAQTLHKRLLSAQGPLYVYQDPAAISLIPLKARSGEDVRVYSDIDNGLHTYARHALSERAYRAQYEPLRKTLVRMLDKAERSAERMRVERSRPSRADEYERLGHILMASPPLPTGKHCVRIQDVFNPETELTVSLDPALNSLQNAERYYSKARKARTSRAHLNTLIRQAEEKAESLKQQLQALEKTRTQKDLKAFQKTHKQSVRPNQPFRRYPLVPPYELWVGRNAKESEVLTLQYARPFDLWMHARGVSGAHAVLRLPGRDARPSNHLIEQAAAIVAWHSKARTSSVAPVIVTPRKYVRKVRGTPTGEVAVSREEVVMVEPALP
ncbi:MAG: NFACT RNA binding domain-containing protein [Bacteroidetes bacterium]|nr:NFACT RNA binding domain-containing protein [Bacteroidota bacterium]